MKRVVLSFVLAAGLMFAAQEHEAGKEENKGSVPEVSVLWKWANFAILAGVLGLLVSKQVKPLLVQRSSEITEGLAAGERAKADADTRAREIEVRLSNLDGAIAEMRVQSTGDRQKEAERIQRETRNEIERIRRQAEMEIESAGKQATLEVRHYGAKLALDLAEQKVRARMNPDTQAALLNNFVKKVADGADQPAAS